ncbi:phosphoadenosine phosphosulfate reductase family protein [Alysiella filiformis DSM 16848]|uniref:Phosphoadenosine phosphosulfate reductase family protein n=1 Tax=Alysiella filiformis DSM 16848 TaxID=1120981 RepID=A0A286E713_9NEIS|nr:phosphoadenosine phosphosulfate reductase family protein [Alysiella filiformis]UBQ55421.1 phosphoadenosine phosphosulfate reductase family protein [Alysiella filiformis DSM 16848]SOD66708.1 Phosphoadenosine phosphosulfate reductase family protein [Alysiella filiformis DSM 16848]
MENNILRKPNLWQIPHIPDETLFRLPEKIATLQNRLKHIFQHHQNVKLANSLAVEDTVILHELAQMGANCVSFVLETGKLNAETLRLAQKLQTDYPNIPFEFYYPNQKDSDDYVKNFGEFAFYESVDLRKRCCFIRKIEPLNRALQGANAWLTGQRREQSITRQELDFQAALCWFDDTPLNPARKYWLKHGTQTVAAKIKQIEYVWDVQTLSRAQSADTLKINDIARVSIATQQPICATTYAENQATGAFILIDEATNHTVAAGMISGEDVLDTFEI